MPKQRDSKIIEAVCGRPWCIEREFFDKIADVVLRHAEGDLADDAAIDAMVSARVDNLTMSEGVSRESKADQDENSRPWTLHGSVAVIPIGGVIARHSGMVNRMSSPSGVGHDTIRRQFNEALADNAVRSIVMHIDSPGGSAQGLETLAAEVFASRSTKPIYSYASGMMASAALYLGAQASEVYADTDSIIGSIGTLMVMRDTSRRFEDAGIKTHVISSGPSKGAGTPGTQISPDQLRQYQAIVDELSSMFVTDLARGRGVESEAIKPHATGDVWVAKEAMNRGLIDGTMASINHLVDQLNERHSANAAGSRTTASTGTVIRPASINSAGAPTTIEAVAAGSDAASAAGEAIMPGTNGTGAAAPTSTDPKPNPADNAPNMDAINAEAARNAAERIADIQTRAQPYLDREGVKALVDSAMTDHKITAQEFGDKLLSLITEADKPKAHIPSVDVGSSGSERRMDDIALSLTNRVANLEDKLDGDRASAVALAIGYDTPELARKAIRDAKNVGGIRLMDVAIDCIARSKGIGYQEAQNKYGYHEADFMAAAFHGSSDFPHLLSNLAKKSLLAQFNEIEPFWTNIARRTTATDFKESTTIRLSESGDLRLILPGGTPEHTTLNERAEKIKVEKYGRAISVTFEMLRNDDLSGFASITSIIGRGGRRLPDQLITTMLGLNSGAGPTMSDGVGAFFATARGNLAQTPSALSYASARAARRAMKKLKGFGPDQAYIEVDPRVLLVPTDLSDTADDLVMQEFVPGSEGANNTRNTLRNRLRAVDSPRLSGTRWYLFADPAELAAFEVKFLDGQDQPTVARIDSKSTPFAQEFWCYLPGVGVAPVNPEAGYSNAGA